MHFLDDHRPIMLWDLDGTLIDSSHRQNTRPDGSLDLEHWISNNTYQKIMADSLLPLIGLFRKSTQAINIAVTARVLQDADFEFFFEHGMNFYKVLSRPNGITLPDATMKEFHLRLLAQEQGLDWFEFCNRALLIDDNKDVLDMAATIGLSTMDAKYVNAIMQTAAWKVA